MSNPKSVAIVAMGMSSRTYVIMAAALGGKQRIVDEVWGINAMGGVIQHDRLFMMDDLKGSEKYAESYAGDDSGDDPCVKGIMDWAKTHPQPIYTSKAYPDYPSSVEFPLEDVMNCVKTHYFTSTIAYALAYAIYLQVEEVQLYGCDFNYADSDRRESGRSNVEFLIGIAQERGIKVVLAMDTTLMDICNPSAKRFYGYAEMPKVSRDPQTGIFSITKEQQNG